MPTKLSPDATAHKSWRDVLPIHPAAELFPLMNESELRELADDIEKHGLREPVALFHDCVLDGRNRLDALELLGRKPANTLRASIYEEVWDSDGFDPYAYVLSKNIHRRHLTADQRRELIANVLKAQPATSNRQIAKQVKADDKTVAKVRTELEATAEIPQLKKTVGGDGKSRKTRKSTNTKSTTTSATEVAARLLVEVTAHAIKADPAKVGQLLAKKLSPELIDKLFGWLDQVFLMARQLDLDLVDRDGHGEKSEAAE